MKNRNKIKLDPGTRALRIISYVFVSYLGAHLLTSIYPGYFCIFQYREYCSERGIWAFTQRVYSECI